MANDDNTAAITGQCYCGRTTIRTTQKPLAVAYCHCADCRRVTGRYDYLPGQVYIAIGILDQADDLAPQLHAHEAQRLDWLHIEDDLERFATSSRSRLGDGGK